MWYVQQAIQKMSSGWLYQRSHHWDVKKAFIFDKCGRRVLYRSQSRFMCIERISNNRTTFREFISDSTKTAKDPTETADTIAEDHGILLQAKTTGSRQIMKSQDTWNELLDVEYQVLLWPKIWWDVVFLRMGNDYGVYFLWCQNTRTEHNRSRVEYSLRMRAPIKADERFSCIHN